LMCFFSSRPKPKLVEIFLSFIVQLVPFFQLLFNYSSTNTFISTTTTFFHLLFNCYISFICCSLALPFPQQLTNYFLLF
jgi:DMSO/TMAO reductase YedYZ heme-binding membrane subunit